MNRDELVMLVSQLLENLEIQRIDVGLEKERDPVPTWFLTSNVGPVGTKVDRWDDGHIVQSWLTEGGAFSRWLVGQLLDLLACPFDDVPRDDSVGIIGHCVHHSPATLKAIR